MKLKAPCLNCPDRKEGCHSKCKKYIQFRKELDIINETEQKRKQTNQVFYSRRKTK